MKKSNWLLWVLAALLLTGCSLARAEAIPEEANGDRWVGFYVVSSQGGRDGFYNNPYLEEYGAITAETEQFGTLDFPRNVLFAVEDAAGNYTFPGLENGYSLFYLEKEEEFGRVTQVVSKMGPYEDGAAFSYLDQGTSITLDGIVYCGPPLGVTDWDPHGGSTIWTFYRVCQTEDGRIYLDGSGDSTNGPLTHTMTETRSYAENGEALREESLSVTVAIEVTDRLERLAVTQFDENNIVICSDDLALREDLPEVACEPETAWVLVEEVGQGETKRTAYSIPGEGEDPISHTVILLDDYGLGRLAYLTFS